MSSRSEPLLWLQGLAIGAIPLELLLIRLVLAGADPGPVPLVERLLIWGVGVVAPAVALWRRPADWGSLLVLRIPTASRSIDQQRLSARQGGWAAIAPLLLAIAALLPLLWWLDESAGLIHEFSPLQEQSRLITLLLSAPLLALIVWQVQQLVQAAVLLAANSTNDAPPEPWGLERLKQERTSFGLQLLQLSPLQWPAAKPAPTPAPTPEPSAAPTPQPEPNVESMVEPETSQVDDGEIEEQLASEPTATNAAPDVASVDELNVDGLTVDELKVDEVAIEEIVVDESSDDVSSVDGTSEVETSESELPTDEASPSDTSELETSIEATPELESSEPESSVVEASGESPEIETAGADVEASVEVAVNVDVDVEESVAVAGSKAPTAELPQDNGAVDGSVGVAAAVKPEQPAEQEQSAALDSEITDLDAPAGGTAEQHGEQAEASRGEQSEPDGTTKAAPGGA